jgi:hypothetical protein
VSPTPRVWTLLVLVAGIALLGIALLRRTVADPAKPLGPSRTVPDDPLTPRPNPQLPLAPARNSEPPAATPALVGTKELMDKCLSRYLLAKAKNATRHVMQLQSFDYDASMGYTPGRLFAQAYPSEAFALSVPLVEDERADPDRRAYALYLIGIVAASGNREAEDFLFKTASKSGAVADLALQSLHALDLDAKYAALYLEKCKQGNFNGMIAVMGRYDPSAYSALAQMEIANPGKTYPESAIGALAHQGLEKMKILHSNWQPEIRRLLLDVRGPRDEWIDWTLRVATTRSLPGLAEVLKERLLKTEEDVAETAREYGKGPQGNAIPKDREIEFWGQDVHYDDVLLAYWKLKGPLNEVETQRLWKYGYLGDPKSRIDEFLDPKPSPLPTVELIRKK